MITFQGVSKLEKINSKLEKKKEKMKFKTDK